MTITGGMGTLFGPVMGAVGIILLRDLISNYTESWSFIMGLLFMACRSGIQKRPHRHPSKEASVDDLTLSFRCFFYTPLRHSE